jgi:histidine triad (HIT) family protein
MPDDNNCIFCRIARKEIPCHRVYEDADFLVFLDAFPIMKGQLLIIPKKHIAPYLFDLDDKLYTKIMLFTKKVAKAVDRALKPIKTGIIVEGLEVEHIHIKVYPLGEQGFKHCRPLEPKPSEQEMKEIAEKIKKAL